MSHSSPVLAVASSGSRIYSACASELKCWRQTETTPVWIVKHDVVTTATSKISMACHRALVYLAGDKALASFSTGDADIGAESCRYGGHLALEPLICANENGVFCLGDQVLHFFTHTLTLRQTVQLRSASGDRGIACLNKQVFVLQEQRVGVFSATNGTFLHVINLPGAVLLQAARGLLYVGVMHLNEEEQEKDSAAATGSATSSRAYHGGAATQRSFTYEVVAVEPAAGTVEAKVPVPGLSSLAVHGPPFTGLGDATGSVVLAVEEHQPGARHSTLHFLLEDAGEAALARADEIAHSAHGNGVSQLHQLVEDADSLPPALPAFNGKQPQLTLSVPLHGFHCAGLAFNEAGDRVFGAEGADVVAVSATSGLKTAFRPVRGLAALQLFAAFWQVLQLLCYAFSTRGIEWHNSLSDIAPKLQLVLNFTPSEFTATWLLAALLCLLLWSSARTASFAASGSTAAIERAFSVAGVLASSFRALFDSRLPRPFNFCIVLPAAVLLLVPSVFQAYTLGILVAIVLVYDSSPSNAALQLLSMLALLILSALLLPALPLVVFPLLFTDLHAMIFGSLLFVPLSRVLLTAFKCGLLGAARTHMADPESTVCDEDFPRALYVVLAGPVLLLYACLCVRLAGVEGRASQMAAHLWLGSWSGFGDRHSEQTSIITQHTPVSWFDYLDRVLHLVMLVLCVFADSQPKLVATALVLCSVTHLSVLILLRPFVRRIVNILLFGAHSLVLMGAVGAAWLAFEPSVDPHTVTRFFAVAAPLAFGGGCLLALGLMACLPICLRRVCNSTRFADPSASFDSMLDGSTAYSHIVRVGSGIPSSRSPSLLGGSRRGSAARFAMGYGSRVGSRTNSTLGTGFE